MKTTKKSWFKRSISLLLALVMCMSMINVSVFAAEAEDASAAVTINDENLRKALCAALGKEYTEGVNITNEEMESLTELDASNCDIKDVTGLTAAVNLESLNLSGNPLDEDKRYSTDNSINQGDTGFAAFLFDFCAFTKLKYLDLSNCSLGDNNLNGRASAFIWAGIPRAVTEIFSILPGLVELNLSDNNLIGYANFLSAVQKTELKKVDLSGNKFNDVHGFSIFKNNPKLEEVDLRDNYINWDDCVDNFKDSLENGVKVLATEQKNLGELFAYGVYDFTNTGSGLSKYDVTMLTSETKELMINNVLGDSITMFFATYGVGQTTKVTVGSEDNKVTSVSPDNITASGITKNTVEIAGLSEGENRVPVSVMHKNGDVKEYTIVINAQKFEPAVTEDSAGIVDLEVQQTICTKLGKGAEAATYVITKDDIASLTGTLTLPDTTTDYSFLQYAVNITTLECSSNASSDLSYIENLTKLTNLTVGDSKEPIDLSKLVNLTRVTSNGNALPIELPELPKLKTLTLSENQNGEISSIKNLGSLSALTIKGSEGTLPEGLSESGISTLNIEGKNGAKYVLKDLPSTVTNISMRNSTEVEVTLYGYATDKALIVANCGGPLTLVNPEAFTNFTSYDEMTSSDNIPDNLGDVSTLTKFSFSPLNSAELKLNDSFRKMTNLTQFSTGSRAIINEMPSQIEYMTSLKTLNFQGSNFEVMDVNLSKTQLTSINFINNSLTEAPEGNLLPSTITELNLSRGLFHYMDVDYSHMTELTTLYLEDVPLVEFPVKLIQGLPSLMIFYNEGGYYEEIPADAFKNSTNLYALMAGSYIRLESSGSDMNSFSPLEGSETAKAIEMLKSTSVYFQMGMGTAILIPYYNGMTEIANYSGLYSIKINGNEVEGLPLARTLNSVLPAGTQSVELTPTGFLSDTVVAVNDVTIKSGETITLNLVEGNNEIKLTSSNDFENTVTVSKSTSYTLNIYVGEQATADDLIDGNWYQIGCKVLKAGQLSESMAGSYFDSKAIVRYKNGKYEVRMTSLKSSWMNTFKSQVTVDGKLTYIDADVIEENKDTNICVVRFTADTLDEAMRISMFVTPMGYSPACDVHFNLSTIINANDQMPAVDTADLVAVINRAADITEKNNIYTDESWQALLTVLEEAKAVAANPVAEDNVAEAAQNLEAAITALVVDESKLADKLALEAALAEAKAVEKGNHTDTAWNAFLEAIADAQTVYDTAEATQSEVDSALKYLNTALTLFNNSGEASDLDKNNLAEGVYSISVDMIKTNRTEKSMADNAINHTAKLEVIDGEYYVTLDFRGITIENRFGYLKNLSYYADGYTYGEYGTIVGELILADVLSTQKDSEGNDVIDQYNDAQNLYPDIVRIKLVSSAIADENGYVPLHVFVPIMEAIAEGNGDQDVLMKLDWTTLKATTADDPDFQPEEPVEQSPAVDYTDAGTGVKIHADKGVFEEGTQNVIAEIASGSEYDNAVLALSEIGKKFKMYDVKFLDKSGNEVEPNGTVTISFPIKAGYDAEKLSVYRINADGSKTLVKGSVEGGMYQVITKTAAKYVLVENGSSITDAENTSNVNNSVQTGDNNMSVIWLAMLFAASCMFVILAFTRKRRIVK